MPEVFELPSVRSLGVTIASITDGAHSNAGTEIDFSKIGQPYGWFRYSGTNAVAPNAGATILVYQLIAPYGDGVYSTGSASVSPLEDRLVATIHVGAATGAQVRDSDYAIIAPFPSKFIIKNNTGQTLDATATLSFVGSNTRT